MLIEFQVSNFRSFRDRQTFSMVAGSYPEHRETNTFDPKLPGFGRLVRSAAVYGANAAGKSNLLFALQFLQQLVLTSAASEPLTSPPYNPFKLRKANRSEPSEFQVSFVQNEIRYEYGVSLDGSQIRDEWLMEYVNPRGRAIFERAYDEKKGRYNWKFSSFLKGRRTYWSEATPANTLFLSRAVQLNSEQLLPVYEWFQKRLVIIAGISTLNPVLTIQLLNNPEGKARLLPFLREADLGITGIDVNREPMSSGPRVIVGSPYIEQAPGSATPSLLRITLSHATGSKEKVGLDISEESAGTQALFRSAGAWLNVFSNGEVLLLDEIDTSLHPLLARFLIARFHSSVSNARNAQLIFTTHNTYFLDQELFRRDQIWFVDKGADGASKVYPLTDFKPRNDEVLDRWYLRGRYGALPVLGESQ
jgi:AAA15 family ATPase/GTPase